MTDFVSMFYGGVALTGFYLIYRNIRNMMTETTLSTQISVFDITPRQTLEQLEGHFTLGDEEVMDANIIMDFPKQQYLEIVKKYADRINCCYFPQLACIHANIKAKEARRLYNDYQWIVAIEPAAYCTVA